MTEGKRKKIECRDGEREREGGQILFYVWEVQD